MPRSLLRVALLAAVATSATPAPVALAQQPPAGDTEKARLEALRRQLGEATLSTDALPVIGNVQYQLLNLYDVNPNWSRVPNYITFANGDAGLGASLSAADSALRTQLKLPEGQGVVVAGVQHGGAAARAGLKDNDILLRLGETRLAGPGDLDAGLMALGGKVGDLDLLREGQVKHLRVRPNTRVTLDAAGPEAPEFFIGVPVRPVDDVLRAHLGVAAGQGLVATDVVADSPAAKAGVKVNDILLGLDGADLADTATLVAKIQASQGKPVALKVLREGKPLTIEVTPRRREPEPATSARVYTLRSPVEVRQLRHVQAEVQDPFSLYYSNFLPRAAQQAEVARPPDDLAKRVDVMSAQIKALSEAIEGLRKDLAPREQKPAAAGAKPGE